MISKNEISEDLGKKKESLVYDPTKTNRTSTSDYQNNGYNNVMEKPGAMKKSSGELNKELISVEQGKTVTGHINSIMNRDDAKISKDRERNLVALKGGIAALTSYLSEEIPMPKKTENRFQRREEEARVKEAINGSCMLISFMYNKLVMTIETCLENKSDEADGEVFRQTLTELKAQCEKERETFKDKAFQYQEAVIKDNDKAGEKPKWVDVLSFARAEYYDIDADDSEYRFSKPDSGASSEVLQLTDKSTNKVLWFNKDVKIPTENKEEMINEIFEDADSLKLQDKVGSDLKNIFRKMYIETDKSPLFKACVDYINYQNEDEFFMRVVEKLSESDGEDEQTAGKFFSNLEGKDKKDVHTILELFVKREVNKKNAYGKVDSAKIAPGSSMAKRHVATSRMAHLLGLQDIICESRTAYLKENGKIHKGNIMENAEGRDIVEICNSNGRRDMSISTDALTQLFVLQVFDAICGQIDRHEGNMHFSMSYGCIDTVKVFDNNMSFGEIGYNAFTKYKNYHNVKPVTNRLIATLPIGVVNRIFNIQKPVLDIIFADVLEKSEINALWRRIHGVQKHIAKCFNYDLKEREQEAQKAGFTRDVYLKYNDGRENDKLRMLQTMKEMSEKDLIQYTYLPEYVAPSIKEIENTIRDNADDIDSIETLTCPGSEERTKIFRKMRERKNEEGEKKDNEKK